MSKKKIEKVSMGCTWTSYVAAAHGALSAAGMYDGDVTQLMGECGIGFHFIMHRAVCESSVTVYDWVSDHFHAMDRIGVQTELANYWNDGSLATYPLLHKDAVDRIKASIDEGRAVVVWAPTPVLEFGLIHGYDDGDGVFFVKDCTNGEVDPLLYDNLGKSQVSLLFFQVLKALLDVAPGKRARSALGFALREWKKEFHIEPAFASGRKAYTNLIVALKARKWGDFGLAYNLIVYADAKGHIAHYLERLGSLPDGISRAAEAAKPYGEAAACFQKMSQLVPFQGQNGVGGNKVNPGLAPQLAALAEEAMKAEQKAFVILEKALAEQ